MDLSSILSDLTKEDAFTHHKRENTIVAMRQELNLMKKACEKMDVLNIHFEPYANTILSKVQVCRQILEINGAGLPSSEIKKCSVFLDKVEEVLYEKNSYGMKVDKFLEKKNNDIIEAIKSNLLELDLDKYAEIQKRLVSFKKELIETVDRLYLEFEE